VKHFFASRMTVSTLVVFGVLVCVRHAQATDISGTISSTVTIFEDSRLVGDVTCAVPLVVAGGNPCIAFGTDHIKLRLNGHTMTGPVDPPKGCSLPSDSKVGVGIEANGRNDLNIEGPGVIQKFQRWGILLVSSTHVTVKKVTANRNCWSGIQTIGTSNSKFEEDILVNNAAGSNGAPCGGICLVSSNNNLMRKSKFYGNGSVDYASGNVDFGIGFEGSSKGNRVAENDIGGNTNGVLFFDTSSDNSVRNNTIAGNPAAQVLKTFVADNQQGADIAFRSSFTGVNNIFEDNFCLTYIGPARAPCPNIRLKEEDDDEARNRLTVPMHGRERSNGAKTVLGVQLISAMSLLLAITHL